MSFTSMPQVQDHFRHPLHSPPKLPEKTFILKRISVSFKATVPSTQATGGSLGGTILVEAAALVADIAVAIAAEIAIAEV